LQLNCLNKCFAALEEIACLKISGTWGYFKNMFLQEFLGKTNRLLPFDTTRKTKK
jgi:hypothetical protein